MPLAKTTPRHPNKPPLPPSPPAAILPQPPTPPPLRRVLKPHEVAALCNVTTRCLWRWEALGKMPQAMRLTAKTVRWLEEDIKLWLENGMDMKTYCAAKGIPYVPILPPEIKKAS